MYIYIYISQRMFIYIKTHRCGMRNAWNFRGKVFDIGKPPDVKAYYSYVTLEVNVKGQNLHIVYTHLDPVVNDNYNYPSMTIRTTH